MLTRNAYLRHIVTDNLDAYFQRGGQSRLPNVTAKGLYKVNEEKKKDISEKLKAALI